MRFTHPLLSSPIITLFFILTTSMPPATQPQRTADVRTIVLRPNRTPTIKGQIRPEEKHRYILRVMARRGHTIQLLPKTSTRPSLALYRPDGTRLEATRESKLYYLTGPGDYVLELTANEDRSIAGTGGGRYMIMINVKSGDKN